MEDTVTVVLHMNKKTLSLLDKAATGEQRAATPKAISLAEWNQTARGKEFRRLVEFDPRYKSMPINEINRIQRDWYREDVPVHKGRPKIHDARIDVMHKALEAYLAAKAA